LITKYGSDVVFRVTVISLVIVAAGFILDTVLGIVLLIIFAVFYLFTLYFFRDPERKIPELENGEVLSPADGKVVLIGKPDAADTEFFSSDEKLMQLSIFMSPLNVHVNRYPISGILKFMKYIPGKYLVAFDEKSSLNNERSVFGIEAQGKKIIFKQIAGFIARRIAYDCELNTEVKAGERFGMIKFGSRLDLIFRSDAKVYVSIGDKVKAGETKLLKLNS
jgi:phosphatidylserine decarboxylase